MWRAWAFLAALPLGALAAVAWQAEPQMLAIAALAAGVAAACLVSVLARLRDDDPERGRHLANAATAGLVAIPALGGALLRFAPGGTWLLALALLVFAVALFQGARVRGPAGGPLYRLTVALCALAGGAAAVLGMAGVAAALVSTPPIPENVTRAMYDFDARVALDPLPRCDPRPARVARLLGRGAHPRLTDDGSVLWYDAASEGRRQVYSLDRATGEETCWTCGENGDNARPAPATGGRAVVFDTNRHRSWRAPANSELHLLQIRKRGGRLPSRRLTFSPGPDDHAVVGPGGRVIAWSRAAGGRYQVVTAGIVTGHGGLLLGTRAVLASGGAQWVAPLAWSPDARSLVIVRGNPMEPRRAAALDPATGTQQPIADAAAGASSASFSSDGGWMALATARRDHPAGLLPASLGFALGPLATALERRAPLYRDAGVQTGEPRGAATPIDLGEVAEWGAPTGVALDPHGRGFVLGQRRRGPDGIEERLIDVRLDCAT